MVLITEDLVRKKAEHNEREICTLQELSLHQENIEKIEHLQNWCKDLQILLLQSNLISRIENVHKLKKLQYLNLALNNIELIENLERCESLEKLDLTLNFIGNIESICNLENNIHLKDLYLTGNPCTDYSNYRYYVVAKLPQLQCLDSSEITQTEKLKAIQLLPTFESEIFKEQHNYFIQRNEQKIRLSQKNDNHLTDEEFWHRKSEHCPEVRVEMAKRQMESKKRDNKEDKKKSRSILLFNKDGRPYNVNQAKIKFTIDFENDEMIILDLAIYKHLDTNLLHVDIQPNFVRVIIKNKIFQIVLPEEIFTDKSKAHRSQTTGHLCIEMPKLHPKNNKKNINETVAYDKPTDLDRQKRREFLEIGPDRLTQICHICKYNKNNEFTDKDSVPPLE